MDPRKTATDQEASITSRTVANRYARALFDVARHEQMDLSQVEQELAGFARLLADHKPLQKVLLNPAIPVPRKRAAMLEITGLARASSIVSKLMIMLADRDRLMLLESILAAYRDRLMDHQKVVRAEVTTAAPIDGDRMDAIQQSLKKATGRSVALSTRVDPALIGGIVARIGSVVYDASLATQLEKMKKGLGS
jgi:F-type H+-transporting ATPase subunit delta